MLTRALKKAFSFTVAFALLAGTIFQGTISDAAAAPPPGWNTLQDIPIYTTFFQTGWSGGDCLETVWLDGNDNVPEDTSVTYGGQNSLRFNVSEGTWWNALLPLRGWQTYDLSAYLPEGRLEFNIIGDRDDLRFKIGLRDRVYERTPEEKDDVKPITDYVNVTTSWQHVSIPLASLIDPNGGFDIRYSILVKLEHDGEVTPGKFWINDLKLTSPGKEKDYPAIKVNQVGYTENAEKYALVSGFDGVLQAVPGTAFQLRKASDASIVYEGALALVTDFDPIISGERVFNADFTSFDTPGAYYITVSAEGIDPSPEFQIGNDIYQSLIVDSARYYYYQRANIALAPEYAGMYSRPEWHTENYNLTFRSDPHNLSNTMDVSGGWYDAGDFGIYIPTTAVAVSNMLWAYEQFPGQFSDNQFNIPESGNGIPDLLDELKYALDWVLKMQDPVSKGFYARVASDHDLGSSKYEARYIDDVSPAGINVKPTTATADAAAILARASLTFRAFDPAYADLLLDTAKSAWGYLEANSGFIAPPLGPYYDPEDAADRLWAAAALYKATGEAKYNTYFINNYQQFAINFDVPRNQDYVGEPVITAFLEYISSDNVDPGVRSWFSAKFPIYLNAQIDRSNTRPWRNTLDDTDYYWGSNVNALGTSMMMVVGSKLLGLYDETVKQVVRANLNYVLGINPLRFSYVSGYGTDSLQDPVSGIYSDDGLPGVPNGILVGGPNSYDGKYISRFYAKAYTDQDTAWATNEQCINYNAPLLFSAAFMAAEAGSGSEPTPTPTPTSTPTPTPTSTAAPSPTPTATPTPTPPSSGSVIYDDALSAGWSNESYSYTGLNLSDSTNPHSGTRSISVVFQPWGALRLKIEPDIDPGGYTAFKFWAHGGSGSDKEIRFFTEPDDSSTSTIVYLTVPAGTWTEFTVPLSSLGNPGSIRKINFKEHLGASQSVIYIDDIRLIE